MSKDIFTCELCGGHKIRVRGGGVGMMCVNPECEEYIIVKPTETVTTCTSKDCPERSGGKCNAFDENQKWLVLREGDYIVVVPDFDSKPHGFPKEGELKTELASMDCPCKPKSEIGNNGKLMIVHNSFIDQENIARSLDNLLNQTK